jgi:hypothetical protein
MTGALAAQTPTTAPATTPVTTTTAPATDPRALDLLQKMSQFLAAANTLKFHAYAATEQLLNSGQRVEFARNNAISVQRPNLLNVQISGDADNLRFVYDGTQITLENLKTNVFGQIPMPPTLDGMFDTLANTHGLVIPLADLVESNPYKALAPLIKSGTYLGTGYVFDTPCHHLAFRQAKVDWQIWIEQGAKPLPRKVVIMYDEPPCLQYTAYLSNWELDAPIANGTFAFAPKTNENMVDALMPTTQPK